MGRFVAHGGGDCVGGSCYQYDNDILIDFGAIQNDGRRIKLPVIPETVLKSLKLFIVTHAHLDHCYGAAVFARENPGAVILMTRITRDCVELQLRDSVKIARKRQHMDECEGLPVADLDFNEGDIDHLLSRVQCVDDESWFTLAELPGYQFSFRSAGHMPGAAMILIVTPEGKRVMHACDYCLQDQALVKGAVVPMDFFDPHVVVTESTYGNRELPNREDEERKLVALVEDTLERDGNILVLVYSTTALNAMLPLARAGVPVLLDGMARHFWRIYRNATPWSPNDVGIEDEVYGYLTCVDGGDPAGDHVLRSQLIAEERPFCVGSPNGRLEGGPAIPYLQAFAEDERNLVLMVGYQGDATSRGNQLLQLEKGEQIVFTSKHISRGRVVEDSVTCRIYLQVEKLQLSGHSDGNAMAGWISQINPLQVITIHGDPEAHAGLAQRINERNANIRVDSGVNGKEITF